MQPMKVALLITTRHYVYVYCAWRVVGSHSVLI
jgi:hypothetical protein